VWETLEIEGYEIAVLSAQQSGDLAAWLDDNGYAFPQGQQATLDYYVSKAWYFVAFKIAPEQPATPDAATDSAAAQAALDPVVISFDLEGGPLVYPMRISQASSEAESEVLLYVLGPHRVRSSSYPTAEVEASSYRAGQSFPAWYDERFRQAIGDAGGTALIVEYAGAVPVWLLEGSLQGLLDGSEYFVTRLRTYLTPEQMTRDVTLVRAPSDDPFEVSITVPTLASSRMGIEAAMLLGGVVQAGRTRPRRWRHCARLLAVLGLVVLIV